MVPEEDAPLAPVGNVGRLGQDLGDRVALGPPQRHEHAGHEREVEAHVALVAVAEVLDDVGRPLVGLGQQHPPGIAGVDLLADPLEEGVGLGEVLAVGALPLEEVGHGVEAEPVEPEVEPEPEDAEHRLLDLGVVVVEVRLVGEEPVPVVLLAVRVPGPVRPFGVGEDDPGVGVALVGVGPHVPVGPGVVAALAGLLEPGVLVGGVVDHQVGDDADAPAVGLLHEPHGVAQLPVLGEDGEEVGDVVAAVPQRGRVERQQPQAVDAQPRQVVELLDETLEVAGAVAVGVEEAADGDLVEDGALEPALVGPVDFAHGRSMPLTLRPAVRAGGGAARGPAGPGRAARRGGPPTT